MTAIMISKHQRAPSGHQDIYQELMLCFDVTMGTVHDWLSVCFCHTVSMILTGYFVLCHIYWKQCPLGLADTGIKLDCQGRIKLNGEG